MATSEAEELAANHAHTAAEALVLTTRAPPAGLTNRRDVAAGCCASGTGKKVMALAWMNFPAGVGDAGAWYCVPEPGEPRFIPGIAKRPSR